MRLEQYLAINYLYPTNITVLSFCLCQNLPILQRIQQVNLANILINNVMRHDIKGSYCYFIASLTFQCLHKF